MEDTENRDAPHDCEHFDGAQLELSVAELKFPPIPRFGDQAFLTDIREALSGDYPLFETAPVLNLVLSPEGIRQTTGGSMLRFSTIDRRWIIGLSEASVTLETRQYTSIDEFSDRYAELLNQVRIHAKIQHQLRFGLRYVNEFRHPGWDTYVDWRSALNPQMLGLAAQDQLGGAVEQTFTEVRTRRPDGVMLVRHGFLRGSTVLPVPGPTQTPASAPKSGPFYLLDLDYSDETPSKFDARQQIERLRRYNYALYQIFRWAIGDGELYRFLKEGV